MKSLLWFLVGIAGGFAAAHVINKNPTGHELLAEVDARIGEFTDRIGEAYRGQEAKFDEFVSNAQGAAAGVASSVAAAAAGTTADASEAAAEVVSDVADEASDTAKSATDAVTD